MGLPMRERSIYCALEHNVASIDGECARQRFGWSHCRCRRRSRSNITYRPQLSGTGPVYSRRQLADEQSADPE